MLQSLSIDFGAVKAQTAICKKTRFFVDNRYLIETRRRNLSKKIVISHNCCYKAQEPEAESPEQIMKYEVQSKKIARVEDREFLFLDSKTSFKNFNLKIFGEDYNANENLS